MDEPSSGLDPLIQREFQAMMREEAAGGQTVFPSHTLSEVQRVADRVGIIRNGKLVAVEKVSDPSFQRDTAHRAQFRHTRANKCVRSRAR